MKTNNQSYNPNLEVEADMMLDQMPEPFNGRILVEMCGFLKSTTLAMPASIIDRDLNGALRVRILKIDPNAFRAERYKNIYDGGHMKYPEVGDELVIVGHAGCPIPGSRGRYQLITDDHIIGVYPK